MGRAPGRPESDVRELDLRELIVPHRGDILLRMQALQVFDHGGRQAAEHSLYAWFISHHKHRIRPRGDPQNALESFLDLYQAILNDGFDRDERLVAVDMGGPHDAYLPPDRRIATMRVPSRYTILDGAHRIAILTHLGHERWPFEVTTASAVAPDYTSFIMLSRIREDFVAGVDMTELPADLESAQERLRSVMAELTERTYERNELRMELTRVQVALRATEEKLERCYPDRDKAREAVIDAQNGAARLETRLQEAEAARDSAELRARRLRDSTSFRLGNALVRPAAAVLRRRRQ
jgi:hypothetical protein